MNESKGKTKTQKTGGKAKATHGSTLQGLFEEELKDIYWAEKALVKAIPKLIRNASSEELVKALESHLRETEGHVTKVEEVFAQIGKEPKAKKCEAIEGMITEAGEIIDETDGITRDAGIISAAQKVEHYEIASYGTLKSFAQTLGLDKSASVLEQILNEEKSADEKLTEVAESFVNLEAAGGERE